MVFSSSTFLFIILPIFLLITLIFKGSRIANLLLLVLSLIFYAWGEPIYVLLMIGSVLVNWLLAMPAARLASAEDSILKRACICLAVAFNIGLLCLFKYAGFIADTINGILGTSIPVPDIALPIGISFFTFQVMSYVIDAYRGTIRVQYNYFRLLLYVSFFPQLIAGPIVRYSDIESQLASREITVERFAQGLRRFIVGLTKKLIISNCVGLIVDTVYSCTDDQLTLPLAWLAAICYCLQIYFDFSGYSDMAIGLGRIAGFDFLENFNYPFTACSIQDFWRRWHISLSTWFREYVYIPLGGNRKGKLRTGVNRVIVFFLTGLWHGAQWTFVIWGLIHGLFLLLETYEVIKPSKWRFKPLRYLYTLFVVCIAFVVFRADSFPAAFTMLRTMFIGPLSTPIGSIRLANMLSPYNLFIIAVACVAATPVLGLLRRLIRNKTAAEVCGYAASAVMAILCVLAISNSTYNPFIYFRF